MNLLSVRGSGDAWLGVVTGYPNSCDNRDGREIHFVGPFPTQKDAADAIVIWCRENRVVINQGPIISGMIGVRQ